MPGPPNIIDHRQMPPGVLPRHLQQWVLIGIALVMIGILSIGGGPTKSKPAPGGPAAQAGAVDANQQRIEEYQRRIQEQAQRLAQEQAALAQAKSATVVPTDSAGGRPGGVHERTGVASTAASSSITPGTANASLQQERAQRDYRSLFADSVAFTRDHDAALASSGTPPGASHGGTDASSSMPAPNGPGEAVAAASREGHAAPATHSAGRTTAAPEARYTLAEGTILETVLTNRLEGAFAGPVNCLVTTAAYAPDTQHLLIPAGSRVLGEARPVTAFGQARLAVVFHRLLLPNGARVDLHEFHALNQGGDVGLQDEVNRHYAQIFGASLAVGAIAGLAQAQTAVGLDASSLDVYRQGAAANLAQSSARILDRFLNLLPTVTIREGHRVKVYLSNDLELPEYRESPAVSGERR